MKTEQEPPTDVDIWNDLQRQIDQLRSENQRLRRALNNIFLTDVVEFVHREYRGEYPVEFAVMQLQEIARQALREMTNSETDYREHLRNMPESEYRRLHENRWENDENEVTK